MKGGHFGPAEKGDLLSKGDEIKTGKKSLMIIRFPDKSTMRVESNSHITFDSIVERVENRSLGSTSMILKAGRAVINVINHNKAPVFKVKHKSVAVGVRGTKFFAGIDEDSDHLDIAVQKGEVEVEHQEENDMADAVEAGHGITIEKGETFTQPQQYDWVDKVNYEANDESVEPDYFTTLAALKAVEFRQKRAQWKRNKEKWLKKKSLWNNRENSHKQLMKRLESKRKNFLKQKTNFLKKKRRMDLKRNNVFKKQNGLKKSALKLRNDRKKLREDIAAYKKGRKDPRKAAEFLRRKKKLDLDKENLSKALSNHKKASASFGKQKGNFLKNAPSSEEVQKAVSQGVQKKATNFKKQQENKIKKKAKRKARKKVRKKLKGLLGF